MNVGFEGLLVTLVLLVPGFIASAIERAFQSKRFETEFEWAASSVLRSVGFNAVALFGVAAWRAWDADTTIAGFWPSLAEARLASVVAYVAALYALAAFWGGTLGVWPELGLRACANRWGLTRVGRYDSVWAHVLDKEPPKDRSKPWLSVAGPEGAVLLGRLRYGSERVARDKPIEVYLDPVYELVSGRWERRAADPDGAVPHGLYLRISPRQAVDLYFREAGWRPPGGHAVRKAG